MGFWDQFKDWDKEEENNREGKQDSDKWILDKKYYCPYCGNVTYRKWNRCELCHHNS